MKKIKVILSTLAIAFVAVFAFAFNKSEVAPEAEPKAEEMMFYQYGNMGSGVYVKLEFGAENGACGTFSDENYCVYISSADVTGFILGVNEPGDAAPDIWSSQSLYIPPAP